MAPKLSTETFIFLNCARSGQWDVLKKLDGGKLNQRQVSFSHERKDEKKADLGDV